MTTSTENVLVQVNLKDRLGALYNVYGRNEQELADGLLILKAYAAEIAEVQSLLMATSTVADTIQVTAVKEEAPAPAGVWSSGPTPPPATSAPSWSEPSAAPQAPAPKPMCQHGPRVGRSGTSAKGEWRAYFCPTPKGTPGQCDAVWVKKGSPDWNNFLEG